MRSGWGITYQVRAWIGYDIASSTYFGVFPAVLFPVYFLSFLDSGHCRLSLLTKAAIRRRTS
jgi:MFS-type transporter involved in bile tolerance (Atg22 family)